MGLFDDIRLEHEKSQAVTHIVIEGGPMMRVRFGDEQHRISLMRCSECESGYGSFRILSVR
jgi:hypothetical protein